MAFSPIYAIKDRHGRSTLLPYKQGVDDGSTLTLDFTTGVLDPRLTFTRAGNATFINSSGFVQYADANYLARSETFDGSPWTLNGVSQTAASITNPVGGSSSRLIEVTASGGSKSLVGGMAVAAGFQYTFRIWVRAGASSSANIGYWTGSGFLNITMTKVSGPGTISTATGSTALQITGLTAEWTQVQVVLATVATAVSGSWFIYPNTIVNSVGNSVYLWGAQANIGATANPYYSTTTAAYFAPRFDYDPTTFALRGLLFEGEGENRALNSETFPTTGTGQWGPTGVNQNATKITSPDGTANAIQFNETTNNELHRINQGLTGSAGPYTISIWAKALDTGSPRRLFLNAVGFMNASALFDLDPAVQTGASGSAVAVAGTAANRAGTWIKYPNGWYRCILVGQYNTNSSLFLQINRASSTTASDDTYAGSATNGLALWGVQVEKGVGASSYIPTGVSQGARVAESCVMNDITALNYSAQQGTIYWNGRFNRQPYDSYVTVVGFMTAIDQPAFETFSNAANYFVAARGSNLTASGSNETSRPYTLNTAIKYAATANTVTDPVVRANLNGSASVANKTGTGDMHVATRFVIGRQPAGTYGVNYPSLTLAQIKYWPFAKSAAELIGLTAP